MVHLLRGRELGFRNILNHNIVHTRCKRNRHIPHKREIGKFRSMYGYDYICTTLVTCGDWISGMNDDIYTDVITWKYRKFPIPPYYYQSDEDPSVYILSLVKMMNINGIVWWNFLRLKDTCRLGLRIIW